MVRVQGIAPSCQRSIEGSGFVISPDHVLTNAHVVAGVTRGQTVTTTGGRIQNLSATVVYYDPQVDVAVLYVPGLNLPPLHFAGAANPGDNAVVAGYPLDATSLHLVPARIGGIQNVLGPEHLSRPAPSPGRSTRSGPWSSRVTLAARCCRPQGTVDGVVFAAAVGVSDTGFALTAAEVSSDASAGAQLRTAVSTGACD